MFVYPACKPTDGGVYPFVTSVTHALKQIETSHQFIIRELRQVEDEEADFVWFLTPHYKPVKAAFSMTVWDLGHRVLPEFPEVSLSGWKFEQREAFYSYVLPRAAIVSTGNAHGKAEIQDFYRISPHRILINPLPVSQLLLDAMPKEASDYSKPYLLYPAQFWPHKNHITLIDAMHELYGFTLICTGSDKGNQQYVEDYAKSQGIKLFCPGFVTIEQLKWFYLNAYAVVFASLLGPDNLPPLEAAALGVPLVTSGDLDNPLDPHEWAQAIVKAKKPHFEVPTAKDYAAKIVKTLDTFAPRRKLWGSDYAHS